jgi:hypothetical protein
MSATTICRSGARTLEFNFHVMEHRRGSEDSRFTVSVWENTHLRAICHCCSRAGALLAISGELNGAVPAEVPRMTDPKWSDIRDLVKELKKRGDADSDTAADHLEDLHARLHNAIGNFELLLERVTKFGALLEEAAAHSRSIGDPNWTAVAIPEDNWFGLLAVYRGKQEENHVYRELQILREIAGITAQTLRTIENWLGHAGTRESAMDALWRLARILEAAGHKIPTEGLEWRGQLVRAMEEAGIAMGEDGALRVRQPEEKNWQAARGPLVKDLLAAARQAI